MVVGSATGGTPVAATASQRPPLRLPLEWREAPCAGWHPAPKVTRACTEAAVIGMADAAADAWDEGAPKRKGPADAPKPAELPGVDAAGGRGAACPEPLGG